MKHVKVLSILGLTTASLLLHTPVWAKPCQIEPSPARQEVSVSQKINVNTADVATIKKLKGVGLSKAKAIVDYREKNGAFEDVNQLTQVRGISTKLLAKFSDQVEV